MLPWRTNTQKSLGKEQGFSLGVMDASAPSLAAVVIIKTRYEQGKYIARLPVWDGMCLLAAGQWGSTANK